MQSWTDTRKPLDTDGFEHRHPLDYWEKELASMPVKPARKFYEPPLVESRYHGVILLMLMVACSLVWFAGTWMIIKFLVAG